MKLNKHGLPTGVSRVMLVNNTDASLRTCGLEQALIRFGLDGTPLPSEFADLFSVRRFDVEADVLTGGNVQTRVIIDWA